MGHTKASQLFTQFCAKMSSCAEYLEITYWPLSVCEYFADNSRNNMNCLITRSKFCL